MKRLAGILCAVCAVCVVGLLCARFVHRRGAAGRPVGGVGRRSTPVPRAIPGAMVLIPGGAFEMGTHDGFFREEEPVHRVEVRSFYLDVTEVTVAAYSACVRRGACTRASVVADYPDIQPEEHAPMSAFCNGDRPDRQDHPANCLDWGQADAYCRAVGRRLPTEAEWEYAARGGSEQRRYAWGDEAPDERRMNACGAECSEFITRNVHRWSALYPGSDGWVGTSPVGSFPAGDARWGLMDVSGNVQEWLSTPFCPYPATECPHTMMTARGPGFLGNQLYKMRVARRNRDEPWHRSGDLGVRCARTP